MDYNYYEIMDPKQDVEYKKTQFYHKYNKYITEAIEYGDKQAIVKILPELLANDNFCGKDYSIFKLIYNDPKLNEYTFYLLHKEYVTPEGLSEYMLTNILNNTSWGFEYVINNLERIISNREEYRCRDKIEIIFNHIKDDKKKYKIFLEKVLELPIAKIRESFISHTFSKRLNISEPTILKTLYKYPDEYNYKQETLPFIEEEPEVIISGIPSLLTSYAKNSNKIKSLKFSLIPFLKNKKIDLNKLIYNNVDILFRAEETKKMRFLEYISDELLLDLDDEYKELLRVYKSLPVIDIDRSISTIINYKKDDILFELIKNRPVKYLGSGSTTRAFKVGEKVFKVSKMKYFIDMEKDLFLLAPTQTEIIYDEKNEPLLIVEIQDYLDKVHNDEPMNSTDINNYMNELENQGYVTTDPRCMGYTDENFGFLKSYKDANCSNPEELPEWFKERPIVMYDIDLVYKKDYPNKKTFY